MVQLVFASFNDGKRREVAALLSHLDIKLMSPLDFGLAGLPPESGQTFLDNAVIKAVAAGTASGLMAVGDDSGLEVDALGGLPGVHSARLAGDGHDDAANNRKLLQMLAGVADRSARFVCTTALVVPPKIPLHAMPVLEGVTRVQGHPWVPAGWSLYSTSGAVDGRIIDDARGADGFGYDPIFFREDLGLTFAQISRDDKNRLSHRGQAFTRLATLLSRLI